MKSSKLLILSGSFCLILMLVVLPLVTACARPAPSPTPAPKPAPAPSPAPAPAPKPAPAPTPTPSPKPSPTGEPIKIAMMAPFSGPFADYGPPMKDGLELLLEEAKYQFEGRPIKLIIEDETGDTSLCLEKAKKLVTVDKVSIILGPLHSGLAMAVAPYLANNKILQIGLMSKVQEINQWGHFVLPWGPLDCDGIAGGLYLYEQLGYRKITSIGADYAAGRLHVGGAVDAFKQKGGTIVQQQWVPLGTIDFGPYLTALKEADACVTWFGGADLKRLLKQHKEFRIKTPLFQITGDQLRAADLKELGDLVLGAVFELTYSSMLDNPLNKKHVEAFRARYGQDRNTERDTYCTYQAMGLVLAGLKATGGDTSFDKLRPAILNLKLDTEQGPLYFHPSGSGIVNRYVAKASVIAGRYGWAPIFTYKDIRYPAWK